MKKSKIVYKIVIIALSLLIVGIVLKLAPNYIVDKFNGKVKLTINNNNVMYVLKNDVIVENGIVYISKSDIDNFFDGTIYYDEQYNQIITTSNTKVAALPIDSKEITINGATITIDAVAMKKDDIYYLPFSEISKKVYNAETQYFDKTNIVYVTSLDRKLVYANSSKNNSVKYKMTTFSKTIERVKKGDTLTIVSDEGNGWSKVATANGQIGYVKTKTLVNSQVMREKLELEKQINGKVSLVWDYFSEYVSAPQRSGKIEGVNVVSPSFIYLKKLGKGEIETNIGSAGVNYINWAHDNNYKVWALVSNNSMKDTTSEIVNDYKLRSYLIENIIKVVEQYDIDGVNLDFEYINEADKDKYTRLVIELAPRLREMGKVLSVDVTAPDGSPDWSLCFNRNIIGKVADYEVYMAYDQYGPSDTKAGPTAAYDWVEKNVKKFINQEEVKAEKLILGVPFYTRIWQEKDPVQSKVVDMKSVYNSIPSDANITWLEAEKQNYAEYIKNGTTFKVWIEDDKSIKEKLSLIDQYGLAGAAFWEKGKEPDSIWGIVKESLNVE